MLRQSLRGHKVCLISALICVLLRWVWHLYNLPCVSVLFWLISIARYVKSPSIWFWATIYGVYCEWVANLLSKFTPGSTLIRTVFKYSRWIFVTGHICLHTFFFGNSEMLDIFSSKSAFIFLAELKFISWTLAYSTRSTYMERSHEHFTCVHNNLPFIFVHASK